MVSSFLFMNPVRTICYLMSFFISLVLWMVMVNIMKIFLFVFLLSVTLCHGSIVICQSFPKSLNYLCGSVSVNKRLQKWYKISIRYWIEFIHHSQLRKYKRNMKMKSSIEWYFKHDESLGVIYLYTFLSI